MKSMSRDSARDKHARTCLLYGDYGNVWLLMLKFLRGNSFCEKVRVNCILFVIPYEYLLRDPFQF